MKDFYVVKLKKNSGGEFVCHVQKDACGYFIGSENAANVSNIGAALEEWAAENNISDTSNLVFQVQLLLDASGQFGLGIGFPDLLLCGSTNAADEHVSPMKEVTVTPVKSPPPKKFRSSKSPQKTMFTSTPAKKQLPYEDAELEESFHNISLHEEDLPLQSLEALWSPELKSRVYVTCYGLPSDTIKEHFIRFVNKELLKRSIISVLDEGVRHCEDVGSDLSIRLEFQSVEVAEKFCSIQNIVYEGNNLFSCQDLPDKTSSTLSNNRSCPSPCVKIGNVPDDMIKEHFIRFINRELLKRSIISVLDEGVMHCEDVGSDLSVRLEFQSVEVAEKFCNIQNIVYEGNNLFSCQELQDKMSSTLSNNQSCPSPCVKIGNVPDDMIKEHFIRFINRELLKRSIISVLDEGVRHCEDVGPDLSVRVEFKSVEVAEKFCNLKSIYYEGNELFSYQEILDETSSTLSNNRSCPSPFVKIGNVPDDMIKEHFIRFINKQLLETGIISMLDGGVRHCEDIGSDLSVRLEFQSVEVAEKFCNIQNIVYEGNNLFSCQEFQSAPYISTVDAISQRTFQTSRMQTSSGWEQMEEDNFTNPQLIPTNRVKVSCLPEGYKHETLLHELNSFLWRAERFPKTVKPAVRILCARHCEATVEFISVRSACLICKLPGIQYEGHYICIEQLEETQETSVFCHDSEGISVNLEEPSKEELAKHEGLKKSQYVRIKNLPPNVKKNALQTFLYQEMVDANNIHDDDDAIEECTINSAGTAAVVRFSCSEQARLASLLEMDYESHPLSIKQIIAEEAVGDDVYTLEDDEEDPDKYVSLDSNQGSEMYLKVLARYRDDFPKKGSFDPILSEIRPVLDKLHVSATVEQLKTRRRSLRSQYTANCKNGHKGHKWFAVASVAFDGAPATILKGTKFEWTDADKALLAHPKETEEERRRLDLIKFSEAASWTNNSTVGLIEACLQFKEEYDSGTRRPQYWRKISNHLYSQQYVYGPEKCKSKMEQLSTEYMKYVREANRTGAPGPLEMIADPTSRLIMSKMHELKFLDVTVNPKRVLGAGVKSFFKEPQEEVLLAQQSEKGFRGRTRPNVLKRNLTTTERKLLIQEKMVEAEAEKAKAMAIIGQALMGRNKNSKE